MDAAVSLSLPAAGALPLPATHPPAPRHHALPRRRHSFTFTSAAAAPPKPAPPLAAARPRSPPPRSDSAAPAPAHASRSYSSSSRAATGYAAALADASARAGTLRRAARHARALLFRRPDQEDEDEETDARVVALVKMLVGKGKAGMVTEVLAEFAAICDRLLPAPARARHAY